MLPHPLTIIFICLAFVGSPPYLYLFAAIGFSLYFGTKLKFALHMLQQSGYKNKDFLRFVFKNPSRFISVRDFVPPVVFFICIFVFPVFLSGIFAVVAYLCLFFVRKKQPAKKPLVYTARVKRLITTNIIFGLAVLTVLFIFGRTLPFVWVLCFFALSLLSPLFMVACNLLVKPIELLIDRHYINDAKRIVRAMPNLTVVGITGSYGKTSTKFILNAILNEKFHTLMTPESYNTTMGVVKTIRGSLTPVHQVFICEMGAKYTRDIKEICDIVHPTYGLLTSIGPQHLETFGSVNNIIKTKYELLDALPDKTRGVINLDSALIAQNNKYSENITYSLDQSDGAHYWVEGISYGPSGSSFCMHGKDGLCLDLHTKLLGRHNIANIVGAAAVALALGVEESKIAYAVSRLAPVEHRLQLKKGAGGISIIDDAFNANPEGSLGAIEVLGSFPAGGRILITPGLVELGEKQYEHNYKLGIQAALHCDYIILVSKNAKPIEDGVRAGDFNQNHLFVVNNLQEALTKMNQIATPGSTVLLENDLPDIYE